MDTSLTPKVSIVMCTYNRASFLPRAVQSVLSQTYTNWELIIIDDASTDNTEEILSQFLSDTRVRYIKNTTNYGLGKNRAESLQYVTGVYLAILDSDDYWINTTKIEQQVALLEQQKNVGVVGTFGIVVDENEKEIKKLSYQKDDTSIRADILSYHQFLHSSTMFRVSAVREIGGYQTEYAPAEDYQLILKIGTKYGFANIPTYMTAYRIHPENSSSTNRKKKTKHALLHLKIILEHKNTYPHFMRAYIKGVLRITKSWLGM